MAASVSIEQIKKAYCTSENGILEKEAKKRLKLCGKNVLTEKKISFFKIFLRRFLSILVYVLIAASFISLFFLKDG